MTRLASSIMCVALAACASAPAGPRPVEPVGVFDFETEVEGEVVVGTIEVTRNDSGYGGTLSTSATEPISVTGVTVEGQVMTVTAMAPDSMVSMVLTFEGNDFTGTWEYAGMAGTMVGSRRTQ